MRSMIYSLNYRGLTFNDGYANIFTWLKIRIYHHQPSLKFLCHLNMI